MSTPRVDALFAKHCAESEHHPVTMERAIGQVEELLDMASQLEEELNAAQARVRELEQVSGELCPKCGWAMKYPDEPCRCELVERVAELEARIGAARAVAEACPYDVNMRNILTELADAPTPSSAVAKPAAPRECGFNKCGRYNSMACNNVKEPCPSWIQARICETCHDEKDTCASARNGLGCGLWTPKEAR